MRRFHRPFQSMRATKLLSLNVFECRNSGNWFQVGLNSFQSVATCNELLLSQWTTSFPAHRTQSRSRTDISFAPRKTGEKCSWVWQGKGRKRERNIGDGVGGGTFALPHPSHALSKHSFTNCTSNQTLLLSTPQTVCVCEWDTDREREESNRWSQTDRRPECVCVTVCEWKSSYTATRTHIHSPEKTGNVCVCFLNACVSVSAGILNFFLLFVSACLVLAHVLYK